MTDLEMTKLCAEAMGYMVEMRETPFTDRGVKIMFAGPYDGRIEPWNPLNNDAQAMALVKQRRLVIDLPDGENGEWLVYPMTTGNPDRASLGRDLNRAIVECVAKMQSAAVLERKA